MEKMKKGGITVETEHIFPIIKRWLYSDKEIFLRELVSNACDAVTKMKQQAKLFKKRALKNAVDVLSDADYKIKSGLADAEDYPYLTIFKIMTEN